MNKFGVIEGKLDESDMVPDSILKYESKKIEILKGPEDEKYILISFGKKSHLAFTKEQIEKLNKILE
jgi:hypothetical protein